MEASRKQMIELALAVLSLLGLSVLLGASVYDAIVLAPNLKAGPAALEHGRLFMAKATPANLFRIAAPFSQIALLAAMIVAWHVPQARYSDAAALAAVLIGDVITFAYHYPRNRILFTSPLEVDPIQLASAAAQWAVANLLRVVLVLAAWCLALLATCRLFAAFTS
jgi:uncharacterized membrane protein